MRWLTRADAKIDRLASAWLIKRRVDHDATFVFGAPNEIDAIVKETGATPYDTAGAELGDVDGRCSFESILLKYGIKDEALDHMARIIHGADKANEVPELPAQAEGVKAVLMGYSEAHPDDQVRVVAAFGMLDALYAWCAKESAQREKLAAARARSAG